MNWKFLFVMLFGVFLVSQGLVNAKRTNLRRSRQFDPDDMPDILTPNDPDDGQTKAEETTVDPDDQGHNGGHGEETTVDPDDVVPDAGVGGQTAVDPEDDDDYAQSRGEDETTEDPDDQGHSNGEETTADPDDGNAPWIGVQNPAPAPSPLDPTGSPLAPSPSDPSIIPMGVPPPPPPGPQPSDETTVDPNGGPGPFGPFGPFGPAPAPAPVDTTVDPNGGPGPFGPFGPFGPAPAPAPVDTTVDPNGSPFNIGFPPLGPGPVGAPTVETTEDPSGLAPAPQDTTVDPNGAPAPASVADTTVDPSGPAPAPVDTTTADPFGGINRAPGRFGPNKLPKSGKPIKDLPDHYEVYEGENDWSKVVANKYGYFVLHPVQTANGKNIFDPYTIGQVLGYIYEMEEFKGQRPKDGWTIELMNPGNPSVIPKKILKRSGFSSKKHRRASLVFTKKASVVAREERDYWKKVIASM